MRHMGFVLLAGALTLGTSARIAAAQTATRIVATPDNITVEVGAFAPLSLQALDENGVVVDVAVQGNGPRGAFQYREGRVEGTAMGQYELIATAPGADGRTLTYQPGSVSVTAEFEGANASQDFDVRVLDTDRLEITGGLDQARTGDVLTFEARIIDGSGRSYTDVPVTWAYTFTPDDTINASGPSGIVSDGKFVGPFRVTTPCSPWPATCRHVDLWTFARGGASNASTSWVKERSVMLTPRTSGFSRASTGGTTHSPALGRPPVKPTCGTLRTLPTS